MLFESTSCSFTSSYRPYLSSGPASRWYKIGIMIKPTKDRNGTYYIRKAVPQELRPAIGKGELKHSLETKNLEQAKLKAPAALAEINAIIQNARAERTVTQDDTEVIASVWMTRILQQPEIIKARYVRQYNYGYGLTADNEQLSECLRKGEYASRQISSLTPNLCSRNSKRPFGGQLPSLHQRGGKNSRGILQNTGSVLRKCTSPMNSLCTPQSLLHRKRKV